MTTESSDALQAFVVERTRLHEAYIREQERTKRLGLILAAFLILAAATMILFAPAGRETLSYWIGSALVIFAAGSVGYKRVWSKTKSTSFGADQDQRNL
jgi:O-antigen/teichoic acid export membrane protein